MIGVIDLLGGNAVHAVAGRRNEYRNIVADGVIQGDAISLAKRYARLGLTSLYIADLDAIIGSAPNTDLLARFAASGIELWIDAGTAGPTVRALIGDSTQTRFILPTESYSSIEAWSAACERMDVCKVVMGLDLAGARMRFLDQANSQMVQSDDLRENISSWIDGAIAMGVESILVLDLSYVGTNRGAGTVESCEVISRHWPSMRLISGGGVRNAADVNLLLGAGCDRVLVATALHRDDSIAPFFSLH
jgi:phosphoribosylformimino-5-aminoimidazole carboxamide ribotide isomerase